MTTNRGVNASRRMLSPATAGYQEEIRDLQTTTSPPNFLRAVVVRVLTNPESLDAGSKSTIKQTVSNPDLLDRAPRNSLVVRVVSGGQDRRGGTPVICYPFFSSHISLPVKTGEQVWVLFEDPSGGGSLPYWIARPSEPSHVEDLNYCHSDRKFDRSSSALTTSQKASGGSSSKVPGFPNGGGTPSSQTLYGANDYETIFSEDPQSLEVSYEPVPRFTKRPGDVVLQGSNNSLIVLGEDRSGGSSKDDKGLAGSIDMVAGRGQTPSTAPDSVKNSRGFLETDKNRVLSNQTQSLTEGDLDLVNDLSRVSVYMKTNGDDNLGLKGKFPEPLKTSIDSISDSPYAIVKSDEVRVVARETGSVRLIKEGPVGGNQCCLIMLPDGVVQLDGDLIYIGRGKGDASEPYIKFSKYKSQLTTVIDEVMGVFNSFTTNFAIPVAAPGTPHPGLTAAIPAVTKAISSLTALKASIDEAKSDRIFGE